MTTYGHLIKTQFCKSKWSDIYKSIKWSPNEVACGGHIFIHNWRGRAIEHPKFEKKDMYRDQDIRSIGVSLLDIVFSANDEKKVVVRSDVFPTCPHEEAMRRIIYTSSFENVANFTGQYLLNILQYFITEKPSDEIQQTVLAAGSYVLRKRLNTVCGQVVGVRKTNTREFLFSGLSNSVIWTVRGPGVMEQAIFSR